MAISELQQHGCLVIFQRDCVVPHIACEVLNLLLRHFTEECIIIPSFFTRCLSISHDLTACRFWLWGYLKDKFCRGNIGNLADLKNQILLQLTQLWFWSVASRNQSYYKSVLYVDLETKWTYWKPQCKCFNLFCAFTLPLPFFRLGCKLHFCRIDSLCVKNCNDAFNYCHLVFFLCW